MAVISLPLRSSIGPLNFVFRKILAVLFGLVLAATGLWASPAGEEEPAAATEKEMVMDPATGNKMVTAPSVWRHNEPIPTMYLTLRRLLTR